MERNGVGFREGSTLVRKPFRYLRADCAERLSDAVSGIRPAMKTRGMIPVPVDGASRFTSLQVVRHMDQTYETGVWKGMLMSEDIHVNGDRVRAEAANMIAAGKDVKDGVGAQWDGTVRGEANFFEAGMEDYFKQVAAKFKSSRENLNVTAGKYADCLVQAIAVLEENERSQQEALEASKAAVEQAADAKFEQEKDNDSLRELLKPLDDLLGTDLSAKVDHADDVQSVPLPPRPTPPLPPAVA